MFVKQRTRRVIRVCVFDTETIRTKKASAKATTFEKTKQNKTNQQTTTKLVSELPAVRGGSLGRADVSRRRRAAFRALRCSIR
jgi:hypothetical protein